MHNTIKIALFTPVSPVRSGLVDHIESLLPALLQHLDITVVTDGSYEPSSPLFVGGGRSQIPWITYQDFGQAPERFDLVIYQLGNEPNIHGYMFDAIHRYPGILILHDLVLHHAIAELTLSRGRADEYRAEIRYSYGARGDELVQQVMAGREREIFARYPLIERILDSSLGVITSNGYMTRYVKKARPALPVCHIPLHLCLPDDLPTEQEVLAYRRRLGLNDKRIIGTTGLYNPNNRLDIALRAFARVIARHPDVVYLLVGAPQDESALRARIASLGLNEHVRMTGWVPADEFVKSMLLLDIGVQLRYPHVGGMSYPPLHLMALGVPVIISDIEPMMDIPANAVIRIPPNHPDEETLLFSAIDRLLSQTPHRAKSWQRMDTPLSPNSTTRPQS